ncbi:hypothetical protein HID58_079419, partial [Brassica napus]
CAIQEFALGLRLHHDLKTRAFIVQFGSCKFPENVKILPTKRFFAKTQPFLSIFLSLEINVIKGRKSAARMEKMGTMEESIATTSILLTQTQTFRRYDGSSHDYLVSSFTALAACSSRNA